MGSVIGSARQQQQYATPMPLVVAMTGTGPDLSSRLVSGSAMPPRSSPIMVCVRVSARVCACGRVYISLCVTVCVYVQRDGIRRISARRSSLLGPTAGSRRTLTSSVVVGHRSISLSLRLSLSLSLSLSVCVCVCVCVCVYRMNER